MLSTFARYSQQLHLVYKHPLGRSIAITTTGFAVSDLVCQGIAYKYSTQRTTNEPFIWDKTRTLKFAVIGFGFGPQFHFWVPFVANLFPGHSPKDALKKVIIDQLCMGQWAAVFVLSSNALMENRGLYGVKQDIKEKYLAIYLRGACIFPLGQFINFFLIPPQYRILWLNGIGFCWRIILSYLVFSNETSPTPPEIHSTD